MGSRVSARRSHVVPTAKLTTMTTSRSARSARSARKYRDVIFNGVAEEPRTQRHGRLAHLVVGRTAHCFDGGQPTRHDSAPARPGTREPQADRLRGVLRWEVYALTERDETVRSVIDATAASGEADRSPEWPAAMRCYSTAARSSSPAEAVPAPAGRRAAGATIPEATTAAACPVPRGHGSPQGCRQACSGRAARSRVALVTTSVFATTHVSRGAIASTNSRPRTVRLYSTRGGISG